MNAYASALPVYVLEQIRNAQFNIYFLLINLDPVIFGFISYRSLYKTTNY